MVRNESYSKVAAYCDFDDRLISGTVVRNTLIRKIEAAGNCRRLSEIIFEGLTFQLVGGNH